MRELAPLPDVASSIRKVPARTQRTSHPASQLAPGPAEPAVATQLESGPAKPAPAPPALVLPLPPEKPARVAPLAPARYHVSFTAGEALKKNLDKARELVGRGRAVESLFEEAMEDLVAKLEKKRPISGCDAARIPQGLPTVATDSMPKRVSALYTWRSESRHRASGRGPAAWL